MSERRTSSRLKKKPEDEDGAAAAPAPAPEKKPKGKPKKPEEPAAAAPTPVPVPPSPAPAVFAASASAGPSPGPAQPPVKEMPPRSAAAAAAMEYEEEEEEEEEEAPPSPAVPMEASQATASQGTISSVEEAEIEPLTFTLYKVDPSMPTSLAERINALLPEFGEKPVAFSELVVAGTRTPIFAFTVAQAAPGIYAGTDYSLTTGDPKQVALLGLVVLYEGPNGVANAKLLILSTRTSLLPNPEGGFVPDKYILFGVQKLAEFIRSRVPGKPVLVRVPRKQKDDPEYLGTLGTLATMGFAYSLFNAEGTPVLFKLLDKEEPVSYTVLEAHPDAGGPEVVTYKYARTGQVVPTEPFTFPTVEVVQVAAPGKMNVSPTVEMVATIDVILDGLVEGKDITIPASTLADPDKGREPRRGGRRRTYRKKARKGKTAKRRH